MNFYQNPAPTPFVTVGNTGLRQPQLQQSIKSHLSQEQYIAELENRLRALWDKYDGDRKHYMDRINRLEELAEELAYEDCAATRKDIWQGFKEGNVYRVGCDIERELNAANDR